MPKVTYIGDQTIEEAQEGESLLDISLRAGIPHYHVCGQVARCSTCRVMVVEHPENLEPPGSLEQRYIREHKLPENIRLACQARVKGPVSVRRLVRDQMDANLVEAPHVPVAGSEVKLAALFSDIRGFTAFSARHLPYDVLHILNRYYTVMGEAILQNNGFLHQYYGDGMLALFGFYARDSQRICLDAVKAGLGMLQSLEGFNDYLEANFGERFNIGIGINFGNVIAGKIGHPKSVQLTVVGDVINRAARVEAVTKETSSPLVISDSVYWEIGASLLRTQPFRKVLRGLEGDQRLYEVLGLTSSEFNAIPNPAV